MATGRRERSTKRNVKKAQRAASDQKTISHLPAGTKSALDKQGATVAQRKRADGTSPKTRAELYEIAKQRDLPGRSKMSRDELARKLGERKASVDAAKKTSRGKAAGGDKPGRASGRPRAGTKPPAKKTGGKKARSTYAGHWRR